MSDAFIKWCRGSTTAEQFRRQIEKFEIAGISLNHPVSETAVLLDVDGRDVVTSPTEIAELIGRRIGISLTLEWWFNADTDLTCTFSFVPSSREIQTYYLDGLSRSEVEVTCDLIRDIFWDSEGTSESVVFDTSGRTAEFDWDDYLLYGVGRPLTSPDLLIVRSASAVALSPPPTSVARDLEGGFVEFRGSGGRPLI
ncbi:hypothetical protein [Micromonospora chersina]